MCLPLFWKIFIERKPRNPTLWQNNAKKTQILVCFSLFSTGRRYLRLVETTWPCSFRRIPENMPNSSNFRPKTITIGQNWSSFGHFRPTHSQQARLRLLLVRNAVSSANLILAKASRATPLARYHLPPPTGWTFTHGTEELHIYLIYIASKKCRDGFVSRVVSRGAWYVRVVVF